MSEFNDADRTLTRSVCLEIFNRPKFLQCFHTICQTPCAEGLLQNSRGAYTIKCPQCQAVTTVPEGRTSALQTNFYITSELDHRKKKVKCLVHKAETLRFLCVDCQIAVCNKCITTEHSGHRAKDLAKELAERKMKLDKCQPRLKETEKQLQSHLNRLKTSKNSMDDEKRNVERLLHDRAMKNNDMVQEELDKALASLDMVSRDIQLSLFGHMTSVHQRLSDVRNMQQEVTHALEDTATPALLDVAREFDTGRGSEGALLQLTSNLPIDGGHPVLRSNDTSVSRTAIQQFLGRVQLDKTKQHVSHINTPSRSEKTLPQCKFEERFNCASAKDPVSHIHAICMIKEHYVFVAYGTGGAEGTGYVAKCSTRRGVLHRSPALHGRVCLAHNPPGRTSGVHVEGKDSGAKSWFSGSFTRGVNEIAVRKYDVYNKRKARFVVRVHHSGGCDVRSVTDRGRSDADDSKVCDVNVRDPVAMDVSKDGLVMAVLEEGARLVKLFCLGNTQRFAFYGGSGSAFSFRPLDVCFFDFDGEERLVVADWQSSSLHVLDVGNDRCKLVGCVGTESDVLVRPTALFAEGADRLWIGCEGGSIVTMNVGLSVS